MSGLGSQFSNDDLETTKSALSAMETLRLGAAHAYYSVSRALRLDKVSALLQRAELSLDIPVALLGSTYTPAEAQNEAAAREILAELVQHFHSTLWMTYRSDFTPISAGEGVFLKTDAGWGCTLRSIQMIAAQALVRHSLGSDWRLPLSSNEEQDTAAVMQTLEPPEGLAPLLRAFWDVPVASSPLSLHNLCHYGNTCGLFPGRWLGPWTGCRALEAAATAANASNALLGLQIAVLGGIGGGAPVLGKDQFLAYFSNPTSTLHTVNSLSKVEGPRISEEEGLKAETDAQSIKDDEEASTIDGPVLGDSKDHSPGLLLLVPLVLGIGKLNPVYAPQLRSVLGMPQSVGIVGGRPGSSVYIVGCQGDAVMYLDPHTIQPAACSDGDWITFHCDVLRTLWMTNLDPSLALGFYCANEEEYMDLCVRLSTLESENAGMPLLCVREGIGESIGDHGGDELLAMEAASWEEDDMSEGCNLEDKDLEEGSEGKAAEEKDITSANGNGAGAVELQGVHPSICLPSKDAIAHPLAFNTDLNGSNLPNSAGISKEEGSLSDNGYVMTAQLSQPIKSAFEDEAEAEVASSTAELVEPSEREEGTIIDDGASEFVQIADSEAGPEEEREEIVRVAVVSADVEESGKGRVELRIRIDSRSSGAGEALHVAEHGRCRNGDVGTRKVGESLCGGVDSNEEKVSEEKLEEEQQQGLSREESAVLVSPTMLRHASSTRSSAWEFV